MCEAFGLGDLLVRDSFRRHEIPVSIDGNPDDTDEDIARLTTIPQIETLTINSAHISARGLRNLPQSTVKTIYFSQLANVEREWIDCLPFSLQHLHIEASSLSDDDLSSIASKNLTSARITTKSVTGTGLAHLRNLTSIYVDSPILEEHTILEGLSHFPRDGGNCSVHIMVRGPSDKVARGLTKRAFNLNPTIALETL